MSSLAVLPDVNLLLAFGWRSHPDHQQCRSWIVGLPRFITCAITELGFLRVSMSPAYRASYEDASRVLESLTRLRTASFLNCDLPVSQIAPVTNYKDTTDCYLVELARKHSLRLATLDEGILRESWSESTAFHPFHQ
jgi:toxin-antitoxin system PIN domain toxin